MMFRIITERDAEGHVIRLSGRLGSEGAAELARVFSGLTGPVRVDCTDLRAADEAGLEGLRGVSPYLRLRLSAGPVEGLPAPPGGHAPGHRP
jgi:hypothetical protein